MSGVATMRGSRLYETQMSLKETGFIPIYAPQIYSVTPMRHCRFV
jgi:hypothetical protein